MFDAEPEGWEQKALGEVITLEYGRALPEASRLDGSVPVYGSNGPVGFHADHLVGERGIVVGRKGTAGSVRVTSGAFWPIDTTYYVRPRSEVDFDWLAAALRHADLGSLNEATGVPGLNRENAYRRPVLLPPLAEQRRIAEVLRLVDEAIAAAIAVEDQAQRAHEAILEGAFGAYASGARVDGADVCPIGDFCERVTYGFTNPMPSTASGPWMITALNVVGGEIDYDTSRHTSEDAFRDLLTDKSRPQPGSVLVTKDGTLGRVAVVDRPDICVNQSVAVLVPLNEKLASKFLSYLLQSATGQERMFADSGGGSVKHIYISKLAKMPIGVPSLETQEKLQTQADQSLSVLKEARRTSVALNRLRTSLGHDLLSGRVRVPA